LQLLDDATGKILGTVSDPSGAAIAGAEITASKAATGVVQDTLSDGFGFYTIQELAVIRNLLTVKKDGFRDYEIADIIVDGNAAVNNNVVLQEERH
jgi:hypothetical protein